MSNKIHSISLVFVGLLFSVATAKVFVYTSAELEKEKANITPLVDQGNYAQAKTQTQKLLADFPKDSELPKALSEIADRYRWADRYEDAKSLYQQIIQNYPDSSTVADAQFGIARMEVLSLIMLQKYDGAKEAFDKMVNDFSKHPDFPEELYWIARKYGWLGRYEDEKSAYQQLIKNCPDSPYAEKARLGASRAAVQSLITSQDYDGAKKALDKMVADFPKHPDLHDSLYWIAREYGYRERHEEEKNAYQRIIKNYPDSPSAGKAQLGFVKANVQSLIMSKDYDGAKEALDKMVADFPKHPDLHDALYWIAERYAWSGRFEDAKRIHQQIIQNYPDSPSASKARLGLSRANVLSLMMSQNHDQAKEALDKMVADFSGRPDFPDTLLTMGRQCYEEGLAKEKEGLADQARDLQEKSAQIWDKLINELPASSLTPEACCWAGDCYFKLGKHKDCIRCFQKVVDDYPQYEHAWHAQFTIGRCYEALRDTAYKQLLEKYPGCPAAERVRNLLSNKTKVEKEEQK
jgi:TolA-binding protein